MPVDPEEVYNKGAEAMQALSEEFNQLCYARHVAGAQEYGEFKFLENDMVRFIAEELADFSNYCRYAYMKLRLLEEYNNASSADLSNLDPNKARDAVTEIPPGFATSAEQTVVSETLPAS